MKNSASLVTDGEIVTPVSRLLTIPRELRNHIYEVALADGLTLKGDDSPRLIRQRDPKDTHVLGGNWNGLQRRAYGLTQVCRQIRRELLAVYRKDVRVRVDLCDLDTFVFGVIRPSEIDSTAIHGNISIDVTSPCRVSLRDVILVHNYAPNLTLCFTHLEPRSDMMSILLDAHRWPEFHAYISEKTTKVELIVDHDDFLELCPGPESESDSEEDGESYVLGTEWPFPYTQGCVLHVKEEFVESWMYGYNVLQWPDGISIWEERLGLKDRKKVRCPITPKVQVV